VVSSLLVGVLHSSASGTMVAATSRASYTLNSISHIPKRISATRVGVKPTLARIRAVAVARAGQVGIASMTYCPHKCGWMDTRLLLGAGGELLLFSRPEP